MSYFVESLYRLYRDNKIDSQKIYDFLVSKKIDKQEYDYIISAKNVK